MFRTRSLARQPGSGGLARGFTMIEMLIVVALIGIVASMALPNYRQSTKKAREAVLKQDLWIMRDVIDQFYTDKGRYPTSLEELVTEGYIRKVPMDPITQSAETWSLDTEPLAESQQEELQEQEQGITDVHSGAPGDALDGSLYTEW